MLHRLRGDQRQGLVRCPHLTSRRYCCPADARRTGAEQRNRAARPSPHATVRLSGWSTAVQVAPVDSWSRLRRPVGTSSPHLAQLRRQLAPARNWFDQSRPVDTSLRPRLRPLWRAGRPAGSLELAFRCPPAICSHREKESRSSENSRTRWGSALEHRSRRHGHEADDDHKNDKLHLLRTCWRRNAHKS